MGVTRPSCQGSHRTAGKAPRAWERRGRSPCRPRGRGGGGAWPRDTLLWASRSTRQHISLVLRDRIRGTLPRQDTSSGKTAPGLGNESRWCQVTSWDRSEPACRQADSHPRCPPCLAVLLELLNPRQPLSFWLRRVPTHRLHRYGRQS